MPCSFICSRSLPAFIAMAGGYCTVYYIVIPNLQSHVNLMCLIARCYYLSSRFRVVPQSNNSQRVDRKAFAEVQAF